MSGIFLAASQNFLLPNATFIVELIAFLIILGILAKYVLPPIDKAVKKRQDEIRVGLEEAEEGRRQLARAKEERGKSIEEARRESRSIIEKATEQAEAERAEIAKRGQEEYDRRLTRAQNEIELSVKRATDDLRRQLVDLVIATSERVIRRQLDTEAHRALIEEAIESVESRGGASGGDDEAPAGASGGRASGDRASGREKAPAGASGHEKAPAGASRPRGASGPQAG